MSDKLVVYADCADQCFFFATLPLWDGKLIILIRARENSGENGAYLVHTWCVCLVCSWCVCLVCALCVHGVCALCVHGVRALCVCVLCVHGV